MNPAPVQSVGKQHKFPCLGDVHLTHKTPRSRTDNYAETLLKKFEFVFDYALNNLCSALLQPGDFFDSAKVPHWLVARVLSMLAGNLVTIPILTVYGQHDLLYHNLAQKANTPLNVLKEAGVVEILGPEPKRFQSQSKYETIDIYGASWGEEIPTVQNPNAYNILVTHRMVIYRKELAWEGQKEDEYASSNVLLRDNDFDLICSGDNHKTFMDNSCGRTLINPGSLGRSNSDQLVGPGEHKPCFVVAQPLLKKFERINIKCKPASEVGSLIEIEQSKVEDEKLQAYVDKLSTLRKPVLDFDENLGRALEKAPTGVQRIISEARE